MLYNCGMLKLIFWIVLVVLGLSFFGISLQSIVMSPAGQANFAYLHSLVLAGWAWITQFVASVLAFWK